MEVRRFNWPLWSGLLLSLIGFASYPLFFVMFPLTRDFPWANLLLFVLSVALLYLGVRRAFASGRKHPRLSKILGVVVASLGAVILGLFIFSAFIMARWLPPSHGAPQVGQKAPEFTLPDVNGKPVSLSELRSTPIIGKTPRGVLLIFYRGYW